MNKNHRSRIRRPDDYPGVREFSDFLKGLDRETEVKFDADGVPVVSHQDPFDSTWHSVRVTSRVRDVEDVEGMY